MRDDGLLVRNRWLVIVGALTVLALMRPAEASVCPKVRPAAALAWSAPSIIDGVSVSTRRFDNAPVPEVRAQLRIAADPVDIFRIVIDYDNLAGQLPRLAVSRIIGRQDETLFVHQRLSMPGPMSDREFVITVHSKAPEAKLAPFIAEWCLANKDKQPVGDGVVIPVDFYGRWTIADAPGEGALVTHDVYMDPGGGIPKWLVRSSIAQDMPALLRAIEARVLE